jgi:predicted nucleic acid-binding protein
MRFWDSSAVFPLAVEEPNTSRVTALLRDDPEVAVWWTARVECWSGLARLRRLGVLDAAAERQARESLDALFSSWTEIEPADELRRLAGSLLLRHSLRAADALQLAAAITAAGVPPRIPLVTLDERLAEAAAREGFATLP